MSGFETMVILWGWVLVVVVYGLFVRSIRRPEPDPVRPSGPID